jgi:flap endonuclease-1
MGIRGLNKLIGQYAKESITEKNISAFTGTKIAIDSEILIYKYRAKENSKNSHIVGFINNVFWFLNNGITPIYIFDGKPIIQKQENAITKRKTQKENMQARLIELENTFIQKLEEIEKHTIEDPEVGTSALTPDMNDTLNQLFKLQRRLESINITKNHKNECKYLLKLMGIPFINATDDAEALCVLLMHQGLVDYVYTEDTDALTYLAAISESSDSAQCKRNFKILRKGSSCNNVQIVDLEVLLQKLELSPSSFVDMCIMSGCDFCSGISRIGPVKSYTLIKKYKTIENFVESENIIVPKEFTFVTARSIFKKIQTFDQTRSLNVGTLNLEDFKTYLTIERGLNPFPYIYKYNNQLKIFNSHLRSHSTVNDTEVPKTMAHLDSHFEE